MKKSNFKKIATRIFMLLITAFIIYSIYIQIQYRQHINSSLDRNYTLISHISDNGKNVADNLNEFVQLTNEHEAINEDIKKELFNNWKIVMGESKVIFNNVSSISLLHTGDNKADWSLLQYSLFGIDFFIFEMTNKFLENQSYEISNEEEEKLEAVITIYRTLHLESENKSFNLDNILQSINEPMKIIDDNYEIALKQLGR